MIITNSDLERVFFWSHSKEFVVDEIYFLSYLINSTSSFPFTCCRTFNWPSELFISGIRDSLTHVHTQLYCVQARM